MQQSAMKMMALLSSLRLTAVALAVLVVGVFVNYSDRNASVWWLGVPFGVLAFNLLAALLVNRKFRRHGGLLIFHVSLLTVFVLGAVAHLMSLSARLEIVEGQVFNGANLEVVRAGPWHPHDRIQDIRFIQHHFRIEYYPGLERGRTASGIRAAGTEQTLYQIGDTVPFAVGGYRFYTTSNKGYAAIVSWLGDDGARQTGAIHFPSFPLHDWKQIARWKTPMGDAIEITLHPGTVVRDGEHWTLDSREAAGDLSVVHNGKPPLTLAQRQSMRLPGGSLRFEDVRMWMGYTVSYNPLLPWFVAAAVVGVGALGWHLWRKFELQASTGVRGRRDAKGSTTQPVAHG